jgi:hypothetical protein
MANVSSNNLTTLYSGGGVNIRPTSAYGNANVVALLNAGTDGANTVTNIVATGNITANNFIGNFVGNITGTANFANYAGNVTVSSQPNITSLGTLVNVSATGNITSVSGVFVGNGAGLTNINGANVNTVANANFAAFAGNVTNSAQPNITSVGTLSNLSVSGNITTGNANLGNLAVANFFSGNGSLLTGVIASGGNSNFANFAGNLINGTSNVNTNGANGNISISVGGISNVAVFANNLVQLNYPIRTPNNVIIGPNAAVGNVAQLGHVLIGPAVGSSPLSNATLFPAVVVGGRGDALTGNGSIAIGHDAFAYGAEGIAVGLTSWNSGVRSITIGSGTITTNPYAVGIGYRVDSLGANSVGLGAYATSVYSNTITINATGAGLSSPAANTFTVKPVRNANTSNVMYYDNSTGEITYDLVSNFVGNVANFANFAGNVTVSAQPNITTLGNLLYANVVDSANVTGTIQQLAPNTITITTNATNNTAYDLTTIYGETSNIVEPGQRAIIRSRGNVSTPATVAVNDVGSRDRVYFYNGTTNAVGFTASVTLSNLNSNSNAFTTGASYSMSTGNPNGDQGNANANSAFNTLSLRDTGQLMLIPGANSTAGSMLNMVSYGQPTNIGQSQGITFSKARGNRDSNLSVNQGDTLGRLVFQGHNGSAFVTNRLPVIRSTVDSTYVANSANIPAGFQFLVNDNTTTYTHNFYANGNVQFSNGATFGSTSQDTIVTVNGNNANGYVQLNGVAFSVIQTDANSAAGYSPFFFRTFQSNTDPIPASKFFRGRGTISSTTAVVTGDQVALNQYAVYADSGNTYKNVFEQPITITGNDGAGNVTANYNITSFNTGSNINLQANTYANSVSISSGGFMKLSSYTAAALTAITGQVGWMAAVTNSAGGSHPNGMIAFWDTTNTRWSYVHDNSAV